MPASHILSGAHEHKAIINLTAFTGLHFGGNTGDTRDA
jgi:hypothetical protein